MDSAPISWCKKLDKLQERAVRIIHYKKEYVDGIRVYKDPNALMTQYNTEKLDVRPGNNC